MGWRCMAATQLNLSAVLCHQALDAPPTLDHSLNPLGRSAAVHAFAQIIHLIVGDCGCSAPDHVPIVMPDQPHIAATLDTRDAIEKQIPPLAADKYAGSGADA